MKILMGTVLLLLSLNVNAVTVFTGGNFTMLNSSGSLFGGTNDVSWTFDETAINSTVNGTVFNGDIESNYPFFSKTWSTHDVRVFGEGIYTFDTTCTSGQIGLGVSACDNPLQPGQTEQYITIEVGAEQLGVHILWDWGASIDTDIALILDYDSVWADADGQGNLLNDLWLGAAGDSPDPLMTWRLVSTDANGDGVIGNPMVDGDFDGYYANFNFDRVVPIPSAVWLFGSGLIGLVGVAGRKKA